jgi:arsenate reductase
MEVQIFGTRKCADTRKALRFFAERRIRTHFVDLNERAASLGELTRFAQKFGVEVLVDRSAKRFTDLGLGTARYSDDRWLQRLVEEPLLLRTPLVRARQERAGQGPAPTHPQHDLTIGLAEDRWGEWVAAAR